MNKVYSYLIEIKKAKQVGLLAKSIGTSEGYIAKHLIKANKIPHRDLWVRFILHFNGLINDSDMAEHFIWRNGIPAVIPVDRLEVNRFSSIGELLNSYKEDAK